MVLIGFKNLSAVSKDSECSMLSLGMQYSIGGKEEIASDLRKVMQKGCTSWRFYCVRKENMR